MVPPALKFAWRAGGGRVRRGGSGFSRALGSGGGEVAGVGCGGELLSLLPATAREERRGYERDAGAHCSSARLPVPSSAVGVGTAGLSRRYHSASSAA